MKYKYVSLVALLAVGFYLYMNKAPLGIRNNNPLNIRATGINWQGAIDESNGYLVFESAFHGLRAAARVLRTYRLNYGLTSVEQIISRWAPPSENDTQSYINHVASKLGVPPGQSLSIARYPELMAIMILHENGKQPYSTAEIIKGFNAGFYE